MQQRHHAFRFERMPKTAIVLSLAVFASAAFGFGTQGIVQTQSTGSDPIEVSEATVAFEDGADVLVDDPAIASQGDDSGPRTVKEFTQEDAFSMFALTWRGDRDIAAFVRAQHEDGSWGPWFETEPLTETESTNGINGTELIYVEPTHKVQVSTSGIDLVEEAEAPSKESATQTTKAVPKSTATHEKPAKEPAPAAKKTSEKPSTKETSSKKSPTTEDKETVTSETSSKTKAPLPVDYDEIEPVAEVSSASEINAVMIDGNAQEGVAPKAETITSGMPPVVSRASWGADESWRCSSPQINDHNSAVVVHHTAGSNNYSQAEAAAQVRGVYLYHAKTLGWCDVGYNALVDKWGTIYEGRAGGLDKNVQGAHAGGFNENTWGISMMGNYVSVSPSDETIKSVGDMAGWRAAIDGFDPLGSTEHISEGTHYAKYAAGTVVKLPNIFAHRDVGLTTCPGDAGYARMDDIRREAKIKYDELMSSQDSSEDEEKVISRDSANKDARNSDDVSETEKNASESSKEKTTTSTHSDKVKATTAPKQTTEPKAKESAKANTKAKETVTSTREPKATTKTKAPTTTQKDAATKTADAKAGVDKDSREKTTEPKPVKTTVQEDRTEPTQGNETETAEPDAEVEETDTEIEETEAETTAESTEETTEPNNHFSTKARSTKARDSQTTEPEAEDADPQTESDEPRTTDITVTLPVPTFSEAPTPTAEATTTATLLAPSTKGLTPVEVEPGSVADQMIQAFKNDDGKSLGDRINTLAGIVYKYLVDQGAIEEPLTITIKDIPINPKLRALKENDANELASMWKDQGGAAGPLGQARSGVQSAMTHNGGVINYAVFDNGLIVNTDATGTQVLPQKIAEAWANQGFDLGKLGLPASQPKHHGTTVTVAFEHGSVSYNTKTKKISVTHTDE